MQSLCCLSADLKQDEGESASHPDSDQSLCPRYISRQSDRAAVSRKSDGAWSRARKKMNSEKREWKRERAEKKERRMSFCCWDMRSSRSKAAVSSDTDTGPGGCVCVSVCAGCDMLPSRPRGSEEEIRSARLQAIYLTARRYRSVLLLARQETDTPLIGRLAGCWNMSQIYVFHVCVSVRICIVWGEGVQLINPIPELLWTLEHCPNWSKRKDGITTPRITCSHTLIHSQAACKGGPGPEGGWELKPGRTLLRRAGLQTGKSRTLRAERASYEKQSEQQREPHIWLISSLLESWWVFFFFLAVRVLVIDWPALFFLWLVYLWNKCTRKTNKQKKKPDPRPLRVLSLPSLHDTMSQKKKILNQSRHQNAF